MRIWLVLVASLVVAVAGSSACGDDMEPSLEEYFGNLETAMQRAEQRAAGEVSPDPQLASLEDWLRSREDLLADLRDDVSEIVTPREVADDHERLVEALNELVAHAEDLLDRVDNARSESELVSLNEEWRNNPTGNELEDRVRIACAQLQEAADENRISVDLCDRPRIP